MNLSKIAGAVAVGLSLAGCMDMAVPVSDGYNRNVLVVNQSRKTVYHFYGSNVGASTWEEDILGNMVLAPGRSVNIDFNDGTGYCHFDFKVVFSDGSYVTESNVNVCQISTYTLR